MLQQYQQSVPIGGGWGSMAATGGSRPTSFLDIQKEQQGGGNKRQTKSNVRPPGIMSSIENNLL